MSGLEFRGRSGEAHPEQPGGKGNPCPRVARCGARLPWWGMLLMASSGGVNPDGLHTSMGMRRDS